MRYLSLLSKTPIASLLQGRRPLAAGQLAGAGDALGGNELHQLTGAGQTAVRQEHEYQPRAEMDRRRQSRRGQSVWQLPLELRSGVERRCGSRRNGEPARHIRVKV